MWRLPTHPNEPKIGLAASFAFTAHNRTLQHQHICTMLKRICFRKLHWGAIQCLCNAVWIELNGTGEIGQSHSRGGVSIWCNHLIPAEIGISSSKVHFTWFISPNNFLSHREHLKMLIEPKQYPERGTFLSWIEIWREILWGHYCAAHCCSEVLKKRKLYLRTCSIRISLLVLHLICLYILPAPLMLLLAHYPYKLSDQQSSEGIFDMKAKSCSFTMMVTSTQCDSTQNRKKLVSGSL